MFGHVGVSFVEFFRHVLVSDRRPGAWDYAYLKP